MVRRNNAATAVELLPSDAFRPVRYHPINTNRECVLDVTWTVDSIDKYKQVLFVKCIDESTGGRVVPKTDV